jgi:hypothetical protein
MLSFILLPCMCIQHLIHNTVMTKIRSTYKFNQLESIRISKNILSLYVSLIYTSCLLYQHFTNTFSTDICDLGAAFLISYYVYDTGLYMFYELPNNNVFILHHLITIFLIKLHYLHLLPYAVGVLYLAYFEISNMFLHIWRISGDLGYKWIQQIATIPFVVSYISLRSFMIPQHQAKYYPLMSELDTPIKHSLMLSFGLITVFSYYFSAVIMTTFIRKKILPLLNVQNDRRIQ